MSPVRVLAVASVCVVLVGGLAIAQQTVQPQAQPAPRAMDATPPSAVPVDVALRVGRAADQQNVDLQNVVQVAQQQSQGRPIGVALVLQEQAIAADGRTDRATTGRQNVIAHVYVLANNQLQDVVVDTRGNKVLSSDNRVMIGNPWTGQSAEGTVDSTPGGSVDRGDSARISTEDRAMGRDRGGVGAGGTAGQQALTLDAARRIMQTADRQNVSLQRIIQTARQQSQGDVIGAFLVLHSGPITRTDATGRVETTPAGEPTLVGHVYVADTDELREVLVDARTNRILATETRQVLVSPWQTQGGVGVGGTIQRDARGFRADPQIDSGVESWPTGSGQGTGRGFLGGPPDTPRTDDDRD